MSDLNPTVYYVDPKHLCPHGFGKAVYCDACERVTVHAERDRYRAALEQIAGLGCVRLLEGDGPKDCSDVPYTCATCIAAAALEEKP